MLEVALIALALGCDAFAVGLAVGTRWNHPRQVFRLSFHFGLFQFLMPAVGWFFGTRLLDMVSRWGTWAAALVLVLLAGKMLADALSKEPESDYSLDPTRGVTLLTLSLATSMDALGVGLSFGMLNRPLWLPAVWIGVTAGIMTWCAMKLAGFLSRRSGRKMGVAGAIVLILIAFRLVLS